MNLKYLLSASSIVKTTSPSSLLTFLQGNGYILLFILLIIEGPIITYVAAFAASLGIFNIYHVLILSLLGNLIGDLIVFLIGRLGKKVVIEKYVKSLIKEERIERIKQYLKDNTGKTIAVIKLTPLLPVPGLILVGASDVPLRKFFFYSSIVTFAYSISMTLLGFYSGIAFNTISKYIQYIEFIIGGAVLLVIGAYFLIKYLSKKILKRLAKL